MKKKMMRLLLFLSLVIGSTLAFSQGKKTVTGLIKDNTGNTLAGATVKVKGTKMVVLTNAAGEFSVVAFATDFLQISSVGFENNEIRIGNQSTLSVTLKTVTGDMGEVVVTALGIKRGKKSLGYSQEQIKGTDIAQSNAPNVINALSGKMAGVNITSPNGVDGGTTETP